MTVVELLIYRPIERKTTALALFAMSNGFIRDKNKVENCFEYATMLISTVF